MGDLNILHILCDYSLTFKAGVQPPEEKIVLNDDPLLDLDLMIGALAL